MSINSIDKKIYSALTTKERILLTSESGDEEFQLDLLQSLAQYEKWKEDNPGKTYSDFLREMKLDTPRINLQAGGNGKIRKISTREFMQMSMRERVEALYGIKVNPSDTVIDIMGRIADLPIIVEID